MLCSHCNITHCFTKPTNITFIIWSGAYGKEVICSDSQVHHLIAYNKSREFYKPYYVLSYVERKKKATNCAGIISFLPACF